MEKQLEGKVQILLSYIEQYEKDYSAHMVGLQDFLDKVTVNNKGTFKIAGKELQKDVQMYLTHN